MFDKKDQRPEVALKALGISGTSLIKLRALAQKVLPLESAYSDQLLPILSLNPLQTSAGHRHPAYKTAIIKAAQILLHAKPEVFELEKGIANALKISPEAYEQNCSESGQMIFKKESKEAAKKFDEARQLLMNLAEQARAQENTPPR